MTIFEEMRSLLRQEEADSDGPPSERLDELMFTNAGALIDAVFERDKLRGQLNSLICKTSNTLIGAVSERDRLRTIIEEIEFSNHDCCNECRRSDGVYCGIAPHCPVCDRAQTKSHAAGCSIAEALGR